MRSEIISGDFPRGATLEVVGFFRYDVQILWHEGFRAKRESLKGKIENIELLDKENLPIDIEEGLSPLEGGIIGGSVAGYDGFLAGYLSLSDNEELVLFVCYLKDGRAFTAIADRRMFNILLQI